MTDLFSRIRFLSMSPDLQASLREAKTRLLAVGERLDTNARAMAALPGTAWELASCRPIPRQAAGLRSERQRLLDAMVRDLENLYAALRVLRTTTALAVVRERNFDAAVPLFEVEEEWRRLGQLHSGCVKGERALLPLDPVLEALDPEERAQVIAITQAMRSALGRVRPQIAILSQLSDRERADLADELRDELVRAEHRQPGIWKVAMRHPGDYLPALAVRRLEGMDEDEGDGGVERGLARRAWQALSSLLARRPVEICRLLHNVDAAWGYEIGAMRASISHYAGKVERPRLGGQTAELFSLDPWRRQGGTN